MFAVRPVKVPGNNDTDTFGCQFKSHTHAGQKGRSVREMGTYICICMWLGTAKDTQSIVRYV